MLIIYQLTIRKLYNYLTCKIFINDQYIYIYDFDQYIFKLIFIKIIKHNFNHINNKSNQDNILQPTNHKHNKFNQDNILQSTNHKHYKSNQDNIIQPTNHKHKKSNQDNIHINIHIFVNILTPHT